MPEPNRPRPNPPKPPQKYVGFEVVEDEPAAPPPARATQPKPRPLPPLPGERPPPAAKPAPPARPASASKPTPAPRPAPAKPAPRPAAGEDFEVVDDDTEVVPAAKAKTTEVRKQPARVARAAEDDDRPRKGRVVRDDDEDDRPRKKKPKKARAKTADEEREELRERRLREFEIIWPTVLLVIGAVMAFAGALGASGLNGFLTIGVLVVGLVISIPVTIATLMVVGMVVGINYGRFGPAVLKIAAITFVVNGVYFIGEWFKVPLFIIGPIGCAVAFGLFKTQFDLDNQETNTSMGALNVVTFVGKVLIFMTIAVLTARQDGGSRPNLDDDPDNPFPTETRPDRGKKGKSQPAPVVMDPDDGDGDDF